MQCGTCGLAVGAALHLVGDLPRYFAHARPGAAAHVTQLHDDGRIERLERVHSTKLHKIMPSRYDSRMSPTAPTISPRNSDSWGRREEDLPVAVVGVREIRAGRTPHRCGAHLRPRFGTPARRGACPLWSPSFAVSPPEARRLLGGAAVRVPLSSPRTLTATRRAPASRVGSGFCSRLRMIESPRG